jgi:hypothetical protein
MKNYDSCLNQGISWKEFEVVAGNSTHIVRFKNNALKYKIQDFHGQDFENACTSVLDAGQILVYPYREDDMARMDEFRVKRNNERFGFSVENPSDAVFHAHS